ncbi:MAG: signal peptidase I, partial [Chloroflexi bacterium]|nr:signal peptidase I [Chloroflexota bacterium]
QFVASVRSRSDIGSLERPRLQRGDEGISLLLRIAAFDRTEALAELHLLARHAAVGLKAVRENPGASGNRRSRELLSLTVGHFADEPSAKSFARQISPRTGQKLAERPHLSRTEEGLSLSFKLASGSPRDVREKIDAMAREAGVEVTEAVLASPPRRESANAGHLLSITLGPFPDLEQAREFTRSIPAAAGLILNDRPKIVRTDGGLNLALQIGSSNPAEDRQKIRALAADFGVVVRSDISARRAEADDHDDETQKSADPIPIAPLPSLPMSDADEARSRMGDETWTDPLEVEGGLRAYVIGIPTRKVAIALTRSLADLGHIVEITRSDIDRTEEGLRLALGFSADDREAGWGTLLSLAEMLDLKVIDANPEPVIVPLNLPEQEIQQRVPVKSPKPDAAVAPPEIDKAEIEAKRAAEMRAIQNRDVTPPEPVEFESPSRPELKATFKKEVAVTGVPPDGERSPRVPDKRLQELEAPLHEGEPAEKEIGPAIGWVRVGGQVQTEAEIQREHERAIGELAQAQEAVATAQEPELADVPQPILRLLALKSVKWGLNGVFAVSTLGAVLLFAGTLIPALLGYKTMIVTSGSMEPTIRVGDAVLIQEGNAPGSIEVDDIITFNDGAAGGMNTHRVRLVKEIQGREHFLTKGDANVTSDPNLVPIEAVYGKAVLTLPRFGRLLAFAGTRQGKLFLIVLPLVILMGKEMRGLLQGGRLDDPDAEAEREGLQPENDSLDLRDAVANA